MIYLYDFIVKISRGKILFSFYLTLLFILYIIILVLVFILYGKMKKKLDYNNHKINREVAKFQRGETLEQRKSIITQKKSNEIFDTLQNLEWAENMWISLNSAQNKLTKIYNAKQPIPKEIIILFIKWLESYKKNWWTIIFTWGFDYDLMDIKSWQLVDIIIDDDKVKVKFIMENQEYTDEVPLQDTFDPQFSFYCR